ncbi:serine/threonine-protein kinase [Kribbella alba]|uniref:Serine/threonine-protein kinase n=2 Tax=Kribbella alba TaxID=190197 RepID=A0ABN2FA85_9ACTN
MGVVYLAEGPEHKEVALKVLRPHVAHDPTARARLEREATTLQKVSHPGVAGILDHDLRGDRPYLVTRFIPGRPLDEQVDDRGPLTPQRWLPLAGCLAESLQAIHQAGVIHRDLKPGNVMMFNGKPVMIDFGIAQAADDLRLTQTGLVIGTPGYLAPELIEGEMVSESADWWGWAATVAYAATGRRPFGKGPFEVVLHRVHKGQADLDGLDPRLKPLLAAALSPDRRDRPTQLEIMTGLNRYAEGRDALIPNPYTATAEVPKETAPPNAQLTRVMPAESAGTPRDPDPVEVAQLVPPVIPPLSAFAPLRDKLREVAAQQKAKAAAVPSHPATYSPTPTAAAPPALPLTYQAGPAPVVAAGPGYAQAPNQPQYQPTSQPQYQPAPQPQYPQHYEQPPQYRPEPSPRQGPNQSPQQSAVAKRPYEEVDAAARVDQNMARSVVLVALMLALAGLMALTPGVGLLLTAVLIVLARTVDRGSTALMRRRQVRGGRGKSDGLVAMAASPVHLIAASLITLFCLILPIVVGLVVGGLVTAGAATSRGLDWQPLSAVGFAAGGLSGLLVAWWGPGGSSLRRGSKITLRKAFRPAWMSLLVATLLLVGAVASFAGAATGSGAGWARTPIQSPNLPNRPGLSDIRHYPVIRDLPLIGR